MTNSSSLSLSKVRQREVSRLLQEEEESTKMALLMMITFLHLSSPNFIFNQSWSSKHTQSLREERRRIATILPSLSFSPSLLPCFQLLKYLNHPQSIGQFCCASNQCRASERHCNAVVFATANCELACVDVARRPTLNFRRGTVCCEDDLLGWWMGKAEPNDKT